MISNFKENNPVGLSIYYSEEKGEQIVIMESNKVMRTISDPVEMELIREGPEYEDLKKFFQEIPKLESN